MTLRTLVGSFALVVFGFCSTAALSYERPGAGGSTVKVTLTHGVFHSLIVNSEDEIVFVAQLVPTDPDLAEFSYYKDTIEKTYELDYDDEETTVEGFANATEFAWAQIEAESPDNVRLRLAC